MSARPPDAPPAAAGGGRTPSSLPLVHPPPASTPYPPRPDAPPPTAYSGSPPRATPPPDDPLHCDALIASVSIPSRSQIPSPGPPTYEQQQYTLIHERLPQEQRREEETVLYHQLEEQGRQQDVHPSPRKHLPQLVSPGRYSMQNVEDRHDNDPGAQQQQQHLLPDLGSPGNYSMPTMQDWSDNGAQHHQQFDLSHECAQQQQQLQQLPQLSNPGWQDYGAHQQCDFNRQQHQQPQLGYPGIHDMPSEQIAMIMRCKNALRPINDKMSAQISMTARHGEALRTINFSSQGSAHYQMEPNAGSHMHPLGGVGDVESEKPKLQQPASHKRSLEDAEAVQSKKAKHTETVDFIPLLDFLEQNPVIRDFVFESGASSIPHDAVVENTEMGDLLADGYVEEISVAHESNLSWAGDFDLTHMLVSKKCRFVKISKKPTKKATMQNKFLDFDKFMNCLLYRYFDKKGRAPPHLVDFMNRVQLLKDPLQSESANTLNLWVLRHHPFFMGPSKCRGFLQSYYTFYKYLTVTERVALVEKVNRELYGRWHISKVRQDHFLDLVYWNGRERRRPQDHYHRTNEVRTTDEDTDIYPFTSEDGFLAIFLRTFIVHGPQNIREKYGAFPLLSLKELLFIVAYYFEEFMAGFIEENLCVYDEPNHKLLAEAFSTYMERRSVSWRAFCNDEDEDADYSFLCGASTLIENKDT